jgi:hypothetical protein
MGKHHQGREVQVMKFTKVESGAYRYGVWHIEKLSGAWLVRKGGSLFPEHSTWATTLKEAKQFIQIQEGVK